MYYFIVFSIDMVVVIMMIRGRVSVVGVMVIGVIVFEFV